MSTTMSQIELVAINTIRTLSMDAVQAAHSGHPGTPMALAPVAYTLWTRFLNYDPQHPQWPNRDRFVLSCGHASMLLYSLLHLSGVKRESPAGSQEEMNSDEPSIGLEDIRAFRQLHSPCAGHPEYGHAAGIETTTGPLGQGIGNSVGMAIASQWLGAHYNRPGLELFNFCVYALCSDGDLMEGVGCEAASLAGHLGLGNLCWIYDDNHITIEGHTSLAFSEDVPRRFEALGWQVLRVDDANDVEAIANAIETFRRTTDRPTLIVVRSVIAWGAPHKANTHDAHGAPLGAEEVRLTKEVYGWPADETFYVPPEVMTHFQDTLGRRGATEQQRWEDSWQTYRQRYATETKQLEALLHRKLPAGWDEEIPEFEVAEKGATRITSGRVINAIAAQVPWFLGGSADLAPSTKTLISGAESFSRATPGGRNFHFGIREHAMAAAANGMALAGLRPYVATFFVFSDYLRPAMRLSAIMKQPVLYVFTHDSIGLGEDGPTHQPIEQLAACRAMPGLVVMRPGDANEVAECYRAALKLSEVPVAMILSRQDVPTLSRDEFAPASGAALGAYVLADSLPTPPRVILMGSGSELSICVDAYRKLKAQGVAVRLVSVPSFELFQMQTQAYRDKVLPPTVTVRVAVEAGVEQGWGRYLGSSGRFIGMSTYGASAPYPALYAHFGITPEHVVAAVNEQLKLS